MFGVLALQLFLMWFYGLQWLGIDPTDLEFLAHGAILLGGYTLVTFLGLWIKRDTTSFGCLIVLLVLVLLGILKGIAFLASLCGWPMERLSGFGWEAFSYMAAFGPWAALVTLLAAFRVEQLFEDPLRRDLGYLTASCYVRGGGKRRFISYLQKGGLLAEAGLRVGDVLIHHDALEMERARGGDPVSITVSRSDDAPWRDPRPLNERPRITVSVRVPSGVVSKQLEHDLGFRCDVKYIKIVEEWFGVLTVQSVRPGGVFHQAGFQEHDILLETPSAPHFFDQLERARGSELELTVVSWVDPPDVRDRPIRELTLALPPHSPSGFAFRWPWFLRSEFGIRKQLETDLGFQEGWERLLLNGEWQGMRTIEQIASDGIMAKAGFMEKDTILSESRHWSGQFPHSWERARGASPIIVRVATWVEPPPLHERPRRTLTVRVPPGKS